MHFTTRVTSWAFQTVNFRPMKSIHFWFFINSSFGCGGNMGGVALVSFDIKHHDQSSRGDGCGGVGVTLKLAHFVANNALMFSCL